jgi:hypothetical protein
LARMVTRIQQSRIDQSTRRPFLCNATHLEEGL